MAAVEQVTIRVSELSLVADVVGPAQSLASTPTLLFLHGSGQTRQSWRSALDEAAKRGHRAMSFDLRGHGDSGWAPDGKYGLDRLAADIREVISQMGAPPILIGASLGGMIGMMIAADPPPKLSALVLVDVTHRIERVGAVEVMAFMESAPNGFASVEEAADAVAAYLPHRERPKNTSGLKRNLRLRDGRYYWHWDPAFMQMGRGAEARFQEPSPLESIARRINIPTLLIRGQRSRILSEEGAREFLKLVPHAEYVDIADAHHMVAGDANDAFNSAVFDFVEKLANHRTASSGSNVGAGK
jgi:pimeloyl-ACP methyl ester carboxylesterase